MDDNIDVNQGGNFEPVHCSRIHYARLKCSEQGQPLNKVLLTVERLRGSYNARILQGCHDEDFLRRWRPFSPIFGKDSKIYRIGIVSFYKNSNGNSFEYPFWKIFLSMRKLNLKEQIVNEKNLNRIVKKKVEF